MDANEKLTIQALLDHDKVHPKFKASIGQPSVKEDSKVSGSSRKSHPSGDRASQKSDGTKNGRAHPKINLFRLVVATRAWHRLSTSRIAERSKQPPISYENTYKTEPDKDKYFSTEKVEELLKETLEHRLKTVRYTAEKCRLLTAEITADIKIKVKALNFPRYKLVCNVIITENRSQGLEIASRCIWNQETDNFASYTFRNRTLIAVANVYGIYFE